MAVLNILVVSFVLVFTVYSFPTYRNQIPNGFTVPDPCNPTQIWNGVGHWNQSGGGPRNPFGLAFAANDHVWNSVLCQLDSDQDGLANGHELGDPSCVWTPGSTPERPAISHPGMCEPVASAQCRALNTGLYCNDPSQEHLFAEENL